jgi:hypothetical protein
MPKLHNANEVSIARRVEARMAEMSSLSLRHFLFPFQAFNFVLPSSYFYFVRLTRTSCPTRLRLPGLVEMSDEQSKSKKKEEQNALFEGEI